MKKFIYTIVITVICNYTFIINNCDAQWQFSNGPFTGDGRCFLVTPSDVHAGTNGHGTLYSTDNGIHWYSSGNIGLTNQSVNCLIQKGANFFAGTNAGVFLSTNSGTSWFGVNTGLGNSTVKTFALIGSTLFAGTTGGIYQTTDNGALWTYVGYGIGNSNINSLLVLNSILYAGTAGGGVFKSTDNGNTWSSANFGLINQTVNILFASGNIIYAGTSASPNTDGVFKTTNFGVNWSLSGLKNRNVYSLKINSSYLYAGTDSGVYRSSNSGVNWSSALGIVQNSVYALNVSGTNLLAGTNEGFAVSSNGGTIWDAVGYLTKGTGAYAKAGSYLYVSGEGVYRSTNNGNSWYTVNNGLPYLRIRDITSLGTNIYAAYQNNNLTQNGIYYSTNNGDEWIYRWNTLNRSINVIKARDSIFYIGLYYKSGDYGLERSNDSGNTFMTVYSTPLYNVSVYDVEFMNANDVYITTSGGNGSILRSTNYGSNWMTVYSGNSVSKLEISGNYIYGGGSWGTGVIMSSNNGQNWASIGLNDKNIHDMASYGSYLFVSTSDSGIFMTNNNGANWYNRNQGIPPPYIHQFGNLFISDNYIFAAASSNGAWRRQLTDIISVMNISSETPSSYSLGQNYPNPFNPTTKIKFDVARIGDVKIIVYDAMGREVQILVNEQLQPSTYETDWNASSFSSGVYFYKITAGNYTETKRMILLK